MKKLQILATVALLGLAPMTPPQAQVNGSGSGTTKPLRIISSFSPGGPVDFVARTLAEQLGRQLGRPVVVENKPGASGALGAMETLRSGADGNTLWITSVGAAAVNPSLYDKLPYDPVRDFAPVSLVANNVEVLVVGSKDPVDDAAAFVEDAKAKKDSTPMASSGTGSIPHLALIQLEEASGARFLHIPYKGMAPAFTDLMGGQVRGVFADVTAVIPQLQGGRLKAIGLAASQRHPGLPGVKTFEEQGIPAVDTNNWYALFAPAKTPAAIVDQLNRSVREAVADPGFREKLLRSGAEPKSSSPEELAELLKTDTAKWGKLIRSRNVKADE